MHTASEIIKWAFVAIFAFAGLSTVASIGKAREIITAERATALLVVQCLFIALVIIFWGK